MIYIGNNYPKSTKRLDNIAESFNGSLTTFPLSVGGVALFPVSTSNLIVALAGLLKTPTTDYTVSGSNITFAVAPTGRTLCSIVFINAVHA